MDKQTRNAMAARVARDIPEGAYVNLGIGLPTLVANHLPADKDIFLHSENGVLGRWTGAKPGEEDWDMINAGKEPISLAPGAAFFHHADSFGMMRGGHLTYACSAPSRSRPTVISPTGTPARRMRFPPLAARWTWPSAPSASS